MRRTAMLLCLCFLFLGQTVIMAQASKPSDKSTVELPPVLIAGMQAFREKGPDEAVKVWLKDGPLEGDKDAMSQANMLRRIQDFYGAYKTFELVGTRDLSQRSRIFYLVIGFEKGPLYGKFVMYKPDDRWMLTSFEVNTKYENVFPDEIVRPSHI